MSSDRHDLLAKILQAKYQLENCEETSKARQLANLHALLDQALQGTNISRHELLEALRDRMTEYRKNRRIQERPWGAV